MSMNVQFCFRVTKEAGMAVINATGEPTDALAKIELELTIREQLTEDEYRIAHGRALLLLAGRTGLKPEWLTPISVEEYNQLDEYPDGDDL